MDSFVIVSFFLRNIIFRSIIAYKHPTFVPDYANVLFKVVVILGVINRVPAAIPEHNVFCYFTIEHILTLSAHMAFGHKSSFKNKCRARSGFGLVVSGAVQVQASK